MRQSFNAFKLRPTLVIRCQPLGGCPGPYAVQGHVTAATWARSKRR
jgi:hypothetical protein